MTTAPARILIARAVPPAVVQRLARHFHVEDNQQDAPWDAQELARRLRDKDGLLSTGTQRIDAALLGACPRLKIVANLAVGYNNFDVAAMSAAGVQGTNAPDVLTETTADFGFALLLAAARRVTDSERYLRAGRWQAWRYDLFAGVEVHGSTLGIIGMGRIGQAVARRGAHGFGMRVLYHNRTRLPADAENACRARYAARDELLAHSDHVLLALPYTPQNHHIIDAHALAQMQRTATLTNIARGGIVDDAALARALREGRIAAAALDVFEGEPAVHPDLLAAPNAVLTPHIASATLPTREAMAQLAADNLIDFFSGKAPRTPVNQPDAHAASARQQAR